MADNNRYLPAPSYDSFEDTASLAPVAEYQQEPEEVGLYPLDRMERLKQAKERKTRLLSKTNNMASLDDSFTDLGNGLVESNANKVWNQLSDQEIQSTFAAGVTNNSLTKGDDGTVRFSDGTVYNGPTKRLYGFGTQDKSNDEVKLGITSGYYDSSERRYNNPKYDVNLGPKGVDIADPQGDVLLPANVAVLLEGLGHGRRDALEGRVVKDIFGNPDKYAQYGSGASEYYNSREALLGTPQKVDLEKGQQILDTYLTDLREKLPGGDRTRATSAPVLSNEDKHRQIYQLNKEWAADHAGVLDRLENARRGFTTSLVDEVFLKPVEAIGDLTGLYDSSGASEAFEQFTGYNPVMQERAMAEIGNQWDVIASDEATTEQKLRAALSAGVTAFTTPEMLTTSMGMVAAWASPGKVLKLLKGGKYINTIAKIDKLVETGELTAKAAKAKKLSALASVDGAKDVLRRQSGHIVSALGTTNQQYKEFVENNGGNELEGAEKAEWFATRFGVQIVNQNLDALVAIDVIKGPGFLKSLVPAVKAMTNKEFSAVAKKMARGVLVSTKGVAEEVGQEYTQTMMELFNTRYGSELFKDQKDFIAFLSDERNIREAGIAALAGAGGALQFEAAGTVLPTAGAIAGGTINGTGKGISVVKGLFSNTPTDEGMDVATVEAQNVERIQRATNAVSSYFAAQGTTNPEDRTVASTQAQQVTKSVMDGTHTVYNSDAEFSDKLKTLKPLVAMIRAENEHITMQELLDTLNEKLAPNAQEKTTLEADVAQMYKVGESFAKAKSMLEVGEEVSDGVRGYRTYLANAYAALLDNDAEGYSKGVQELSRFARSQRAKRDSLLATTSELEGRAAATIKEYIRKNGLEDTDEVFSKVALSMAKKESAKKKRVSIKAYHDPTKQTKATEVFLFNVYHKLAKPEERGGSYKVIDQIEKEIIAIDGAHNELLSAITGADTSTTNQEEAAPFDETSPFDVDEVPPFDIDTPITTPTSVETAPLNEVGSEIDIELPNTQTGAVPFEVDEDTNAVDESETYEVTGAEEQLDADIPPVPATGEFEYTDDMFDGTSEYDGVEDYDGTPEYDGAPETYEGITDYDGSPETYEDTPVQKDGSSKELGEILKSIKKNKQDIAERKQSLREARNNTEGKKLSVKETLLQDVELQELIAAKEKLDARRAGFESVLTSFIKQRVKGLASLGKDIVNLYTDWNSTDTPKPVIKAKMAELFSNITVTGYTLDERTVDDVQVATRDFIANLTKSFPKNWNADTYVSTNPLLALMFGTGAEPEINYNVVEAVHAAAAEFLVQDAIKLVSYNDDESVAALFGVKESEVTSNMRRTLQRGGTTMKLAAATVGSKVLQNLGIIIDNEAQREAIATAFGVTALEGLMGTYLEKAVYKTESTNSKKFLAEEIPFIRGIQKTSETSEDGLFDRLDDVRNVVKVLEETRGVDIDKSHGYRKVRTAGNRKVQIRRKEFLSAPKDHTDAVNIMENAPMKFNSGHTIFMDMFSTDGVLDADRIVERLLGPIEQFTNFDARERYKAQKEAVLRNVKFYEEAAEDVGDGELFFDWFIATNHRIHLDSNRLNPQADKQMARWLVTGASSRTELDRSDITAAVDGDTKATREAVSFAYAIVQAFDGAKIDGVSIVSIDKSGQEAVLADAKKLLALDEEALKELSLSTDHLGHSCLGIANILKYQDATGVFESDIVLETDGLTNGFAFRSLQYPIFSEDIGIEEWLEKVGVVLPSSKYYNTADSMNTVIGSGLSDVYVTVGKFFGKAMGETRSSLTGNSFAWVTLLERYAGKGGLPNFSEDTPEVKKFIRNLTKSPVTVFNYAASPLNIAADLVSDQVRGGGYMKGRGIIDLLTAKDGDKYLVTEKELKKQFGNDVGAKYHKARVALNEQSLDDYTNRDIKVLRTDLTAAISDLYAGPLVDTLNGLFGPQAEINQTMIHAAQFMFEHFKTLYDTWKQYPDNRNATAEDKQEFLAEIVNSIPGVAGASSSSAADKIAFLKDMLEPTNHDVLVGFPGQPASSANAISRGFREPGVAPAVLTVLGLDSSILAQTIVQGYRNDGNVTLPVHDAEVKGVGEYNNTELYNRNFYTSNRSYSILQGFVDAITQLENDPNATKLPLQLQVDGKKKRVTFERMAELLRSKNDEVQKARAVIFTQDVKIGQMVGENGAMTEIKAADRKAEALKYLAKASENITIKTDNLLKTFASGNNKFDAATAKNIKQTLNSMLKGCK